MVTGDVSQIDLPKGGTSGLVDARPCWRASKASFTQFDAADVVRHRWWRASSRPMTPRDGRRCLRMPAVAADADARHRGQLPRHRVARWIRAALAEAPADITVRIVGDEGRALNRDYRGGLRDQRADLRLRARAAVQADLVLCAPVVEREARRSRCIELQAHYAHLLVHGTLHAQGYDHETSDADAARMERSSRGCCWAGPPRPCLLGEPR